MHAAEHRAHRELTVTLRAVAEHWPRLAPRLGRDEGAPLVAGAQAAEELVGELTGLLAARGLPVGPSAQGLGARAGAVRAAVVDRTLEVNQAVRLAALGAGHAVTLLRYLERLAAVRGDTELSGALMRWAGRLGEHEGAVRGVAVALGDHPDRAIEPAVPGLVGRTGHALASALGSLGERVDALTTRTAR